MRLRILGGGWYGSHLAAALLADGHDVELHEKADRLFAGASGANPARLHQGQHYPRSKLTRAACQEHHVEFMAKYGNLTRCVPINLYAVAAHDSWLDFGTYSQVLRGEIEYITVRPEEFGLRNVEGAILTGERHIVIDEARAYFEQTLNGAVRFGAEPDEVDSREWDATIDCTFCANDSAGIDRFEPCVTAIVKGPTDKAVTIMDGPFPSLYVWNEAQGLSSLTSAKYTPLARCATRAEAESILASVSATEVLTRAEQMLTQMELYWPTVRDLYKIVDCKLSIRAMPRSGADARLVDVVRVGERALRIRAGKIDAILHAERLVKDMLA